jgi:copper(I)-binding protein
MKWLLVALSFTTFSVAATAHEITLKSLKVVHPWVYETDEQLAALHLRIKNTSNATEHLLRATSAVAEKVSILDAQGKETTGLPIAAYREISLPTGGPQIILSGLKKPLRAYASFDVILVFARAGEVSIEVIVEAPDTPR